MEKYIELKLPGRKEPEKMLWLAYAFADTASVVMRAMIEDDSHGNCGQGLVVSYLCRHALELYFKGAIGIATGKMKRNDHRLDKLYSEYKALYSDKGAFYFFDFLVEEWVLNGEDWFPKDLSKRQQNHDQSFRYPADKNGISFFGLRGFNVLEKAEQVERFSSTLNRRAFLMGQYGAQAHKFLNSDGPP